jgi:hypothetical protein
MLATLEYRKVCARWVGGIIFGAPFVLDSSEQLPPPDFRQCKYESQTILSTWPCAEFYEKAGKLLWPQWTLVRPLAFQKQVTHLEVNISNQWPIQFYNLYYCPFSAYGVKETVDNYSVRNVMWAFVVVRVLKLVVTQEQSHDAAS